MSFANNGYTYTITSDTAQLKTCTATGFTGGVVIPAVVIPLTATNGVNTYNVTAIGANAFTNRTGIQSITITDISPSAFVQGTNSLTIGLQAFAGISALAAGTRAITIPTQVTVIGNEAFRYTNLTSLVFAPNSNCTTIGDSAFDRTNIQEPALAGPLTIPNTVTSIGASAFAFTQITSLTITDINTTPALIANTLTIGANAFKGIITLNSQVTIPTQVTVIGVSAFQDTTLTLLSFTNGSKCTTIGTNAFKTVVAGTSTLAGALTIPSTVTSIGVESFALTKLISITIEEIAGAFTEAKALTISTLAFQSIRTLTGGGQAITIPKQVVSIGEGAFQTTNLTSLVFKPESNCTTIGKGAFTGSEDGSILSTLEGALTIPNTVTLIGDSAFNATKITALTITDIGITAGLQANELTIGLRAFEGITTLTAGGRAIIIPKQVVSIGLRAFKDTNLLSLEFANGSKCTTIGNNAFAYTIGTPTLAGPLIIPNTVTSIGNSAFALTKITALTITDIGTTAGLQGNELTIGPNAFQVITTLTAGGRAIIIPKQVKIIGDNAFDRTNLTSLEFANGSKCTTIGINAFTDTSGGTPTLAGPLTIPNTVTAIGGTAFGNTQITALTITDIAGNAGLNANELTIGGGAFGGIQTLIAGGRAITIPKQVISIGNLAFADTNLTSLAFTNGSKCATIGEEAFKKFNPPATLVGELAIPASLTSIGQQAFVGTGLVTLTLVQPTATLAIATKAFLKVSTLRLPDPFALPVRVTAAADAFQGTNLVFRPPTPGQTFTSDNNLYLVTSTAPPTCTLQGFSGAPTATLTVPATATSGGQAYTVTAIAANAYKDNTVITTLQISAQSKLVTIGPNTFQNALNLTLPNPLTFPATIQVIGQNAFAGTGLTIIYPADMQLLANGARSRASVAGRLGST